MKFILQDSKQEVDKYVLGVQGIIPGTLHGAFPVVLIPKEIGTELIELLNLAYKEGGLDKIIEIKKSLGLL